MPAEHVCRRRVDHLIRSMFASTSSARLAHDVVFKLVGLLGPLAGAYQVGSRGDRSRASHCAYNLLRQVRDPHAFRAHEIAIAVYLRRFRNDTEES
jgi:hypothetical protein